MNAVCRHFKFGFCKFGDLCHKRHVKIECEEKDCDIKSCNSRHPKPCTYFQMYGRCKFSPCFYSHTYSLPLLIAKTERMEERLTEKDLENENLKKENVKLNTNVELLMLECAKIKIRLENLECKSNDALSAKNMFKSSTESRPSLEINHSVLKSTPSLKTYNCEIYGLLCCDHEHTPNDRPPEGDLCCNHRCRPGWKRR